MGNSPLLWANIHYDRSAGGPKYDLWEGPIWLAPPQATLGRTSTAALRRANQPKITQGNLNGVVNSWSQYLKWKQAVNSSLACICSTS